MSASRMLLAFLALAIDAAALVRNTTHVSGMQKRPPFGHPSAKKSYPVRPGFTLWLVEEFDEPLDLDADPFWTWSDGGLSEGQVRFVKEAIVFKDGAMHIVAAAGHQPGSCSHAEVARLAWKDLTSGEIRTKHNMFRYGFYEVRMKAPSAQPGDPLVNGNYISTMFAYRDAKFKHWREIDIEVTGDTPSSITMNVLNAEYTTEWSRAIQSSQKDTEEGQNVRARFHTYAFEWLPSGITWYFDGSVIGHHGPDSPLPIPDKSTKIIMNFWIFNKLYSFGGSEGRNNRYPMHSEYDWFRFYKWDGDEQYPCLDGSDSCLTADDRYLSGNNPCDGIEQVGGPVPCLATCTRAPQPQPALTPSRPSSSPAEDSEPAAAPSGANQSAERSANESSSDTAPAPNRTGGAPQEYAKPAAARSRTHGRAKGTVGRRSNAPARQHGTRRPARAPSGANGSARGTGHSTGTLPARASSRKGGAPPEAAKRAAAPRDGTDEGAEHAGHRSDASSRGDL